MYSVTVIIKASNPENPSERYKPVTKTGLYIPKTKTARTDVIERETIDFHQKYLQKHHPNLNFTYKVKINKIKTDFHIVDGEE